MSASKAWNLAGLKAALAIAGPESAADLRRMPEEVGHGASHLGLIAHTAAFSTGGDWLDALLRGLDENRTLLGDLVDRAPPRGAIARTAGHLSGVAGLPRTRFRRRSTTEGLKVVSDLSGPARWFRDHARVALSSGHVFGTGGAGHVRVNFATSQAILTEAISRMGRAVRDSTA